MRPFPDQAVGFFRLVRRALDARDPVLCRRTARIFREHGVVSVPTLVSEASDVPSEHKAFVSDAKRMALLPPSVRDEWKSVTADPDPIEETLGPGASTAAVENTRVLHAEGVTILAGTDVGNYFLVPGLSLHREFERLTKAGTGPRRSRNAERPARSACSAAAPGSRSSWRGRIASTAWHRRIAI